MADGIVPLKLLCSRDKYIRLNSCVSVFGNVPWNELYARLRVCRLDIVSRDVGIVPVSWLSERVS